MRCIFLTKFLVGLALTMVLLWSANPAKAQIEPIELIQSKQALLADQRLVGNVSAHKPSILPMRVLRRVSKFSVV